MKLILLTLTNHDLYQTVNATPISALDTAVDNLKSALADNIVVGNLGGTAEGNLFNYINNFENGVDGASGLTANFSAAATNLHDIHHNTHLDSGNLARATF